MSGDFKGAAPPDHSGHRKRIKEKYYASKGNLLYDYEVLELLLTFAIPRRDVQGLAKELLEKFGSLQNVMNAGRDDLLCVKGLGKNSVILFDVINDINGRITAGNASEGHFITDYSGAKSYFRDVLGSEKVEKFMLATLDNANKIISCSILAVGQNDSVEIPPRKIFENVIKNNAYRVIIAHNHPRDIAEPSAFDIDFTLKVRNILQSLNAKLIDHIIVGTNGELSMRCDKRFEDYFL